MQKMSQELGWLEFPKGGFGKDPPKQRGWGLVVPPRMEGDAGGNPRAIRQGRRGGSTFRGRHGPLTLAMLPADMLLAAAVAEVISAVPLNGKKHKVCHGSSCLHNSKCQVVKAKTAERDIKTQAN